MQNKLGTSGEPLCTFSAKSCSFIGSTEFGLFATDHGAGLELEGCTVEVGEVGALLSGCSWC